MSFSTCFHSPCRLSAESSIHSAVPPRSSSSIKSIFRRHFFKKCYPVVQYPSHQDHQKLLTPKSQRVKGSNIVQQVNPKNKSHSKSKPTYNYDMSILHDDELNNSYLAERRRPKKKIPFWANEDQLQLAMVDQVHQDKNPEDIFGYICIDDAVDMVYSLDIMNKESITMFISLIF